MALTLADLTFPIERATICAAISDPYWCNTYNRGAGKELSWSLDINAEALEVEDERWKPYAYHQSLSFPITRWMGIEGQSVSWDSTFDEISGEPNGSFYVFEHEAMPRGELRFSERDGLTFHVNWEGLCNVHWNDKYGENVPFSICAIAKFTSLYVHGSESDDLESLIQRLSLHINPDDFTPGPLVRDGLYNSGVGMSHCEFVPKL